MDDFVKRAELNADNLKAYAGYFYNQEKLLASSSGGMATAIAEAVIGRGGVVFGVTYSADFKSAEYCCVAHIDDLHKLKGSKYITSQKSIWVNTQYISVYSEVQRHLDLGKLVLFIGLGCDVAALYRFCERNHINVDNLYTMDLICYGPTSPRVAAQFIESLEKKYNQKIVDFTVRYKKSGWQPAYLRAVFESGEVYEKPFYGTDYGRAFSVFPTAACFQCKFKGAGHEADLTVGDCWGIDATHTCYNKNGVSVALVGKPKGKQLLDFIDAQAFYMEEIDVMMALEGNPQYYTCRKKSAQYDSFKRNFEKRGLRYAAFCLRVKSKIKYLIARALRPILRRGRHEK